MGTAGSNLKLTPMGIHKSVSTLSRVRSKSAKNLGGCCGLGILAALEFEQDERRTRQRSEKKEVRRETQAEALRQIRKVRF